MFDSDRLPPIGVFDSGLGGLSVVREMLPRLPGERIIYVGDSVHAPYGAWPEERIRDFSFGMSRFLIEQTGCRGLVIACNTATAAAADALRAAFTDIPIIGMEPAVKPAAQVTRTGIVGILATVGTLASARFAALLERYKSDGEIEFVTQPCPGLPEAVERGELDTPATRTLVENYVRPLTRRGADTLVLGCTHYPVLRPLIAEIAGPTVVLIDTGEAVARRAACIFGAPQHDSDALRDASAVAAPAAAALTLFTTAPDVATFARGAGVILGWPATPPVCRLFWQEKELTPNAPN